MTSVAPTVSAVLRVATPAQAKGPVIREIVTDLGGADLLRPCERVAVLAPDALGDAIFQRWREEMPFLDALHRRHSLRLRAVMPTITPVNFATMVSGTDLEGHGVRTREQAFQCETLFDVVRSAGGRSAGVGRKGYTGSELLARCADIPGTAMERKDAEVADLVIRIAEADRPLFLIAQLGGTDDVFHRFGPSSPEVVPMLREMDGHLKRLVGHLSGAGYGVIVLADHGQHDVREGDRTSGSHGTDSEEDRLVPCTWMAAGTDR